jgi:predicted lipid-binding transport protein (Tim44 family)
MALVVVALISSACGSSEPKPDAARSPVPRVAPSAEPEENFDEAPAPAAGPAAPGDKAAAKICGEIGGTSSASSPEDYLRKLAESARQKGVPFHRLLSLLQRAYAKGEFDEARGYIDRLATICADFDDRRNF